MKTFLLIFFGYCLGVIILLIWPGLLYPVSFRRSIVDVEKTARTEVLQPDSTAAAFLDSLKLNPPEGYGNFIIAGSDTVTNAKYRDGTVTGTSDLPSKDKKN